MQHSTVCRRPSHQSASHESDPGQHPHANYHVVLLSLKALHLIGTWHIIIVSFLESRKTATCAGWTVLHTSSAAVATSIASDNAGALCPAEDALLPFPSLQRGWDIDASMGASK